MFGWQVASILWSDGDGTGHLEVPVHHAIAVAVVDWLQDLLDAVGGVRLGVELPGYDILKQLPARHSK